MAAQPIDIDLNPELFNNLYWQLKDLFANEAIRYIWIKGGSSASKTFTVVQADLTEKLESGTDNSMIFRKFSSDIIDSIYSDYKGMISDWGIGELYVCQQNLIKCSTGSQVRFRGLDDPEKIKGLTRVKRLILEEISQFDEKDFKQARKRLRGRKGQQIVGLFNPISEDHWIKVNIFDKDRWVEVDQVAEAVAKGIADPADWTITKKEMNEKGNAVILTLTYLDNKYIVGPHFVDQHVIDDFEFDKLHDYNEYRIYGLGEWGKIRTGGEFYKHFDPAKHVRDGVVYSEDLALHVSWDENVNPYLPCGIFQLQGKELRMINEIALSNPRNKLEDVCEEIMEHYPDHTAGMFIYGDATSRKEDVKIEKGYNFFKLIARELKSYDPVLRVALSNPSVVMRGNFINKVLLTNFEDIKIVIGSNCKKAIEDFVNVKEASDGTKHKEMVTDDKTKVRYQKYGHFTDLFDYIICKAFEKEYQLYQKKDKRASKRRGGTAVKDESNRM